MMYSKRIVLAATAVFAVTNSWGSGYQGQVTVTNDTSTPITSWRVEFDLPSSTSIITRVAV